MYALKALSRGEDTREACLNAPFCDTLTHVKPDDGIHISLVSFQGKTNPVSLPTSGCQVGFVDLSDLAFIVISVAVSCRVLYSN